MRLFIALPLPPALRDDLADLAGGLQGARWVVPENYHLTLRFVGEVANPLADELDHALAALRGKRLSLSASGTAVFERGGRITALRAGIRRDDALDHLQSKIETAVQRAGLPPERRRFQPHVTLARVDGVAPELLASWVQAHNLLRSGPHPIDRFVLFSSQTGHEQPVYLPEVEYELV